LSAATLGEDLLFVNNHYFMMMSADDTTKLTDEVCASCGVAGVDDTKLKKCACNLVKYCSVDCQKNHRPKHKKACKKRLAEMHDKDLFTQPDISHMGECPICFLPLPLHPSKSTLMGCCCKYICNGCEYANMRREDEGRLEHRCAFCREHVPGSEKEFNKLVMKRIKKNNDPAAMSHMGKYHEEKGDFVRALEYYTKAAELGDANAHACLGGSYYDGEGVDKDTKKGVYHWEQAAIGGHPSARVLLAMHEEDNCRFERAAKHYIIAANLGNDNSLQCIKDLFAEGKVSKEEYAAALRGHQAAVNETKSAERDKADEAESFGLLPFGERNV
jgi:tetratricopeptide (TPR) repeat protein